MRIFITGANGWVGSALVPDLLAHGHQVLALARSDATAKTLKELGAEVVRGDIESLDVLKSSAAASDGAIHLAFTANFDNFAHDCEVERGAIQAMADGMAGTGKPLIMTGGTFSVADIDGSRGGQLAAEDATPIRNTPPFSERIKTEDLALQLSKTTGVNGMVIRLSPTVHGKGDIRFVTQLGKAAQQSGKAVYVGEADARWPAVHRSDAATLYRLAIEKGKAGQMYHAVAEEAVPMKDIIETIAKKVGVPAESASRQEASQVMGMLGAAIAMDDPVSSDKTRKELGWEPTGPKLLEDIEQNYFL